MPVIFNFILAIMRRILPEKMTKRLMTYSDSNVEAMQLPSRCLPVEFGGDVGAENIAIFISAVEARASEIENKFAYLSKWVSNQCEEADISDDDLGSEI